MAILVACEFSGVVRDAFAAKGVEAWSCDLLPSETPGNHIQDDVLKHLGDGWDLMIAHPPCTYLTNAGSLHLYDTSTTRLVKGRDRWGAMIQACRFFNKLKEAPIPRIVIENPVPHQYARERIGLYNQIIHPYQHGHGENKPTCLWLKGVPRLKSTDVVEGREPRLNNLWPSENRSKERSRTYSGIAQAMADQWSDPSKFRLPICHFR